MKDLSVERSPRARLGVIMAIVFFGFLGLSMPYLIFPSLFLNPDYSILPVDSSNSTRGLLLGITLAAYPLGQFFGAPILGALSDDYSRRKVMSGSLVVAGLCSLVTAFSLELRLLWLLISSRFVAGLMEGNLAIARAMAADIKQLNKHDTFGKINAAASVAYVLGPLVGGLLSDRSLNDSLSLATPFYVICTLFMLLAAINYFGMADGPRDTRAAPRSFEERINFVARLRRLFQNRHLKLMLLVVSLYTLAVDMFFEFGPVYLTTMWLWGPAKLAVYTSVLSLALAIGSAFVAGRLAMRYPDRQILKCSMATLAGSLVLIVLASSPISMMGIYVVTGFAIAITSTNLTVQVSDSVSDDIQGEVMGVQTSLRVLGDALICLLGGVLLAMSPSLVLLLAATVSLSSLLYYLRRTRPNEQA